MRAFTLSCALLKVRVIARVDGKNLERARNVRARNVEPSGK